MSRVLCACGCGEVCQGTYKLNHWPHPNLDHKFWGSVDERGPDECWMWRGRIGTHGYGEFYMGRTQETAHRMAAMLSGRDPRGAFVCHTCDNKPCCNPSHLYIGTPLTNARDFWERGTRDTPTGRKHPRAKLTDEQVQEIRNRFIRDYTRSEVTRRRRTNAKELAEEFGIHRAYVLQIARGVSRVSA